MADWQGDFYKDYEQPQVSRITVGFTGIDPSKLAARVDDEQLMQVLNEILNRLSNLKVKIDSGNVDPNADEPYVTYVPLKPDELPHEKLGGLLGGDEDGHYHLTRDERDKLNEYPDYSQLNSQILHERLTDLLGGNNNGHYHLTNDELDKLGKLIAAFIPADTNQVTLPVDDHEKLSNLLGGSSNDHYHLTGNELTEIQALLAITFPNGPSSTPVFPNTPNPSPSDDPGTTDPTSIEYQFGGLPVGTPPAWTNHDFPLYSNRVQFSACAAVNSMYYGKSCAYKTGTPTEALHVLMEYGNNSSVYMVRTTDLNTWYRLESLNKKTYLGGGATGIAQYMPIDTKVTGNAYRYRLYLMMPGYTSSTIYMRFFYGSRAALSDSAENASLYYMSDANVPADKKPYMACADSGNLHIFVTAAGVVARAQGKAVLAKETTNKCGVTVNPGCCAWSPSKQTFCVTGPDGTATSQTGKDSWTVNKLAPKNLVDLIYRADLPDTNGKTVGGFFARSAGEKVFYASYDGLNWFMYNTGVTVAPIPLQTIEAVTYCPDYGWYCAVGSESSSGKSKYAYFSKNLGKWIGTKVSDTDIEMGSVIWMPSTRKFVLMPKSGATYYTFDPASWRD